MKHFILAATLAVTTALSSAAFAQGGNDPISGIDIIIKKDPAKKLVSPGQFGAEQIGLTYDAGPEKLNIRLRELVGQTLRANGFDNNWRLEADASTMLSKASQDLSAQIADGDAGKTSFTYRAKDGRSKITVTLLVKGDGDEGFYRIEGHMGSVKPALEAVGCVTEAGATDANCDGVDDATQATKFERTRPTRPAPRIQRR
jgi:hypothetical protein